jgi:hypothetical protein
VGAFTAECLVTRQKWIVERQGEEEGKEAGQQGGRGGEEKRARL